MIMNLGVVSARTDSNQFPASSPKIRWEGRTVQNNDGSVSFNWSGVYMNFTFKGTKAYMVVSDTGKNYFDVFADGKLTGTVSTSGSDSTVVLYEGAKGTHTLMVRRRTEGSIGITTVTSVVLPDGGMLAAPPQPKSRRIEVIGDSFTCGYGTESDKGSDPFTAETENCGKAYGCLVADYFGAEYTLVSHSGRGVVRNYGDELIASADGTMDKMYGYAFDDNPDRKWTFTKKERPDIVLIYLGENDFSTGKQPEKEVFIEGYRTILSQVRAAYGDVPVLCIAPFASDDLYLYVKEASETGDPNVHFTAIFKGAYNRTTDLGASEHPNYLGQQKLSLLLLPYISTITGWTLIH